MSNVIQMPSKAARKKPEDMYFCTRCNTDQFYFWADGVVMCTNCCLEINNLKVVPK